MKKNLMLALVAAAMCMHANAGDIQKGKAAVEKNACASCHGADLNTPINPEYPKLAGQHADYIEHALKAYKNGDNPKYQNGRSNPIMAGMAKSLQDDDIRNIAAYIGSLKGTLHLEK